MSTQITDPPLLELRPLAPPDVTRVASRQSVMASLLSALRQRLLLVIVVVVPMLLGTAYYGLIAADVYEAEAHFVVRSASGSSGLGSISVLMPSTFSRANDDTHSVNAYIRSRDAIERLIEQNGLLDKLARPEADFLQRFPRPFERATREALAKRFPDFVSVSFDSGTGISTLKVRAFRPADAREIALALAQHSEELINRLNQRAREDSIRFAREIVEKAELRVNDAQNRIAEFRASELVFDPAKQSQSAFELSNRLFLELATLKASLAENLTTAPNSPQVATLRAKISAYEKQIEEQRQLIAGGAGSLAPKLARYEQLALERELATKSLTSALASLENSRQDAQRQQLYLERIVEPALPDQARHPRRLLILLGMLFVLGCAYATLHWLAAAVMEHHV